MLFQFSIFCYLRFKLSDFELAALASRTATTGWSCVAIQFTALNLTVRVFQCSSSRKPIIGFREDQITIKALHELYSILVDKLAIKANFKVIKRLFYGGETRYFLLEFCLVHVYFSTVNLQILYMCSLLLILILVRFLMGKYAVIFRWIL